MKIYAKKGNSKSSLIDNQSKNDSKSNNQLANLTDNRSVTTTQLKLKNIVDNSPQVNKAERLQSMVDKFSGVSISAENEPIQKKENKTGLPNNLKSGVENLSGYAMDDVSVHYNSAKPAQLQAHAYAQGTDIHLSPGQEKHLPHEAWHVVQQKQGRVKPTTQLKGSVNVNDNVSLEKEADVMGAKSLQLKSADTVQMKTDSLDSTGIIQMAKPKSKDAAEAIISSNTITWDYEEGKLQSSWHKGSELNKMLKKNGDEDAYKLGELTEYDIYVIEDGYGRGAERLVVGYSYTTKDYRCWYTSNHYKTFSELF